MSKPSKFRLVIKLENEAFEEDHDQEIARILFAVAEKVRAGEDGAKILDVNGNTVGMFRFED